MHRVEPYRYLVWLFTRLPLAATADDYADLMPWRMPAAPNL
nr:MULTISPECIES: transposase domain-containing protein [Burkholderia cepacia complex]